MATSGTIKSYNSKGGSINYRSRPVFPNNGGDPKPIRARRSANGGLTGAKVTNTAMFAGKNLQRHASLGMGVAMQRGRGMDL